MVDTGLVFIRVHLSHHPGTGNPTVFVPIALKIGHDGGMRPLVLKGSSDMQHYILSTTL